MTEDELYSIESGIINCYYYLDDVHGSGEILSASDMHRLIAEVRRLQAENTDLVGQLHKLQEIT